MASARSVPSKEQFLCSVCLEMFSLPVTLPCGHNFCKACITGYWDSCNDYPCPLCMKIFQRSVKDTLQVNTILREVTDSLKSDGKVNRKTCPPEPGEILCDVCTGTNNHITEKAVRSCWQCLVSFCQAHLELHHQVPGLQRHRLMEPVHSLEERVCRVHSGLLDSYCHTHTVCVCPLCLITDHGVACAVVTLETECNDRRAVQEAGELDVGGVIQEGMRELLSFWEEVEEHLGRMNTRFTHNEMTSDPAVTAHLTAMVTLRSWVEEGTRTLQEEASKETMRAKELKKLWKKKDYYLLFKSFLSGNRLNSVTERVEGIRRALEEQNVTFNKELNVLREQEQSLRKLKKQQRFLVMAFLCFLFVLFLGSVLENRKSAR